MLKFKDTIQKVNTEIVTKRHVDVVSTLLKKKVSYLLLDAMTLIVSVVTQSALFLDKSRLESWNWNLVTVLQIPWIFYLFFMKIIPVVLLLRFYLIIINQ